MRMEVMMNCRYFKTILSVLALAVGVYMGPNYVFADSAEEIDRNVESALELLYEKSPSAKAMGEKAEGILVFPSIVKGGFIVGGQFGEGALLKNGETIGYFNTVQVSYGLQLGLQKYGYALFFMSESALNWIDKSNGWEIGVGPTIVVIDVGAAGAATTTTSKAEVYAFFFGQKGLMAGLGLQGTKITKVTK
jgi:lipid-binding SYLF domain-containing protein